jgi:predicted RNA-binding protein YlqC (UPF0109 family)
MDPAVAIQEFLEYVVGKLISHPEDSSVIHRELEGRQLYRIIVHGDDVGLIVGRTGKTISAIRSLVDASCRKSGIRAELEPVESREE